MPDPGSTRKLGNDERDGLAKHGIAGPRGQIAPMPGRSGRFGRMFPELAPADLDVQALDELTLAMDTAAGQSDPNLDLPAGYTYLAQFVDHDLTFDPNSRLDTSNDPYTLADFRTPRLDLDSVYGSGPMDQPFLYRWDKEKPYPGVTLLVAEDPHRETWARFDLPRNLEGRALIGDARNDENLIISQLHALLLRFHNYVVDHVSGSQTRAAVIFEEAQRLVRWHYQWLVLHDLLWRIVGEDTANAVLTRPAEGPRATSRRFFHWSDEPFMPVEFSGAAYRFGHSLVREDYKINDSERNVPIVQSDPKSIQLGGFRRVCRRCEIDWPQFFPIDRGTTAQRAMRIDPSVARALTGLPPDRANLVQLNLRRGSALGLPAGRDVALAMGEKPLEDAELLAPPIVLDDKVAKAVVHATPLWYYVLCEAQARGDGKRLGPVGGRIVAEVLVGLVEGDPASYLRQNPLWTPADSGLLANGKPITTMADLVTFVQHGDPAVPVAS